MVFGSSSICPSHQYRTNSQIVRLAVLSAALLYCALVTVVHRIEEIRSRLGSPPSKNKQVGNGVVRSFD